MAELDADPVDDGVVAASAAAVVVVVDASVVVVVVESAATVVVVVVDAAVVTVVSAVPNRHLVVRTKSVKNIIGKSLIFLVDGYCALRS